MSILDALKRGWWQGVAAWPEYVGGAIGLVGDVIPGEDDPFARQSRIIKEFGSDLAKSKAPEGESEGILEKIAQGLGAAPLDLTTYIPAGVAGKALKLKGLAKPAFTFGATSAIRAGGEGLPTVVGEGLRGAVEGAAFGKIGDWAGKYGVSPAAKKLIDKQQSLILAGDKQGAQALDPLIRKLTDTTSLQLARKGRHALGAGGLGAGIAAIHGDPLEDIAASAGVMGMLGFAQSGRFKRSGVGKAENVALVAKEIREYADKQGKKISEAEALRQAEAMVKQEIPEELVLKQQDALPPRETVPPAGRGPSITLTDIERAGIEARPYAETTDATKARFGTRKTFFERLQENYEPLKDEKVLREIESNPELIKLGKIVGTDYEGNIQIPANRLPMVGAKIKSIMNARDRTTAELKQLEAFHRNKGNHAEANAILEKISKVEKEADGASIQARGIDSEIGRALQKSGLLDKESPEWRKNVKFLEKKGLFEKDGSGEYRRDIKELMQLSEGRADLQTKLIKALNTPSLWDKFMEYWVNGLLSGPPTQMVNLGSNALTGGIDLLEKRFATKLEAKKGIISKDQAALENSADIRASMVAVPESIKVAAKLLRAGEDGALPAEKAWAERFLGGQERIDYTTRAISGKAGKIFRIPTLALRAGDIALKIQAGHRGGVQKALRMAYEDATLEKLPKGRQRIEQTKEAITQRAEEYLGNKLGEIGGEPHPQVLAAMQKEAKRLTYTQDPDLPLQAIQRARNISVDIPGLGEVNPLGMIIPFTSTPYRVIRHAVARSPLGIMRLTKLKEQYRRGEITSSEYHREIVGTAMGSALTVGMAGLAQAGFITGGGPVNPQDRANKIAQGWRPYSLHVPGWGYMPLQRIEPLGTILGLAADFSETLDADKDDKAGKIIAMVKDNITNKSFLQGLEQFSSMLANPEQFGPTWAKQMIGSVVPTGVAKVAQAIDPYSRKVEPFGAETGILDPIAARIPGMTQALPIRTTPFGEKAERWGTYNTGGILNSLVTGVQSLTSPIPFSAERSGMDVEKEFDRLSGYEGMPPSTPKDNKRLVLRGIHGEKVELTKEDMKVFDRYHAMAKQQLEQVIASPQYQRMPDDYKAKMLSSVYKKFRSAANKEINARIMRRTTLGD